LAALVAMALMAAVVQVAVAVQQADVAGTAGTEA
jgi:hypothetical protein